MSVNDGAVDAILDLSRSPETYEEYKGVMARLLSGIDPRRPYGTALFNGVARISITIALEAVAMRYNEESERVEVYLRQRGPDEAYPGEWHCPGTVMRSGETLRDMAGRLADEFGTKIRDLKFLKDLFHQEERGWMEGKICLTELEGDPRKDDRHNWFPVDNLPEPMVGHHLRPIIPLVANYFYCENVRLMSRV